MSNYSAASVSDLIADIGKSGKITITLTAPTTSPYILTAVNNTINGANGLPLIKNQTVTIFGNGDTIERSTTSGYFRLFDVGKNGSLTLVNLTLQNGMANGWYGGGILNEGTLLLNGVTMAYNQVFSLGSQSVAGGGIWSNGSLTLENGTLLEYNRAIGGPGGTGNQFQPEVPPGAAFGGAVYVAGGTANITNTSFMFNAADGGPANGTPFGSNAFGGALYVAAGQVVLTTTTVNNNFADNDGDRGGFAAGGGLYVAGGTVTLSNDTVESNEAQDYGGGLYVASGTVTLTNDTVQSNAVYDGGGIYIASGATVYIDAFTLANTINNTATIDPNIDGTYIQT